MTVYRQPYAVTLQSFMALEDMERIERIVAKGERIELGYVMNAAQGGEKGKMHPLEKMSREYAAELRRDPSPDVRGGLTERERANLAAIFSQYGRVRTPEPVS